MKAISLLALLFFFEAFSAGPEPKAPVCTPDYHTPASKEPSDVLLLTRYTDYKDCYLKSKTLKTAPQKFELNFKLEIHTLADGSAENIQALTTDVKEVALKSCILDSVKRITFPQSKKGTVYRRSCIYI